MPLAINDDAMTTFSDADMPELTTGSKSSKSSSFHSSYHSSHSDNDGILADISNFEEIGLDDESRAEAEIGNFAVKTSTNPYSSTYSTDLRSAARSRKSAPLAAGQGNTRSQRDLTSPPIGKPLSGLRNQIRNANLNGLGIIPTAGRTALRRGSSSSASAAPIHTSSNRNRSPGVSPIPQKHLSASQSSLSVRRGSWNSTRERKTALELEKECDDDDGDEVPDECFLENVPISPRPPQERIPTPAASTSTSPERPPKEKIKPLGNGTSPRPAEQGELRSPRASIQRVSSMGQFPIDHNGFKPRAKSWTAALSELSEEAKALTEALEAHDDEEMTRQSFNGSYRPGERPSRVQSSLAELPPLRRTEILIDPLPISKEKEAVLSRTRPSWLPPKNPAEEKRHLKEYQKMMSLAMEADRKKEVEKKTKSACRDDTASSLLRIWEEHVLPNWDHVVGQKRTRELWWRGIAPRSRGDVWAKAIGNNLSLSESSYTAALRRAHALETTISRGSQLSPEEERKKAWLHIIDADVVNTYPELRIFQPDGPLHGALSDVLKAYAMYRSDIGYIHGTSTIAALLLLNLDTPSAAFQALSNILNRTLPLSFHSHDTGATSRFNALVLSTLEKKSTRLHKHLTSKVNLDSKEYLQDMFSSLFTDRLSLDNATRLWDIMVFEGDAVLVRAAVAYLMALESKLFGCETAGEVYGVVRGGLGEVKEDEWIQFLREAGKA